MIVIWWFGGILHASTLLDGWLENATKATSIQPLYTLSHALCETYRRLKNRGSNRSLILTCCSPIRMKTNLLLFRIIFKCLYAKKSSFFEDKMPLFHFLISVAFLNFPVVFYPLRDSLFYSHRYTYPPISNECGILKLKISKGIGQKLKSI